MLLTPIRFFTDSFDTGGAGCSRRLENGSYCEFDYNLEFEPMWSVTLTIATAVVGEHSIFLLVSIVHFGDKNVKYYNVRQDFMLKSFLRFGQLLCQ